jgi:plastocyanin
VRRLLPFAILGACLAVGVLPALATDGSVGIRDFAFTPSKVAVTPGGIVSWAAEPGYSTYMHSVHFDDQAAALGPASSDFSASRTFDQQGTYTYHCDVHPTLMRGTVYVNATGTVPTPSPTPSPSASPTPSGQPSTSPSPSPGGGGSGGGGSAGSTTAPVTSFRVTAASGRRGVFLTFRLGAGATVRVRGTLRRGARRVRRVTLLARPGRHRLKLPGRRLAPGRYKLTLKAGDLTRTVRFRVRR